MPAANIILNDEKLKTSSKIRSKTRMPNLATFIQHSIESLSNTLKPKKKKKKKNRTKESVYKIEAKFWI